MNPVYKVYMDWEFHEQGVLDAAIDAISIGMVTEDGKELYLQNIDADWGTIEQNPWLVKNVLPHLAAFDMQNLRPDMKNAYATTSPWRSLDMMRAEVQEFLLGNLPKGSELSIRGWYADYDHAIFAGLWGRMIDMPMDKGIPIWTFDVKQKAWMVGDPRIAVSDEGDEHNALDDAKTIKARDIWLDGLVDRHGLDNEGIRW
jgi:hypothetical protein